MAEHWRYIAQRILTGEWLDRVGAQMSGVTMTWDLQTDQFAATITPQDMMRVASDGLPLFDEWSTAIYAVEENQIRWGGLLIDSQFTGPGFALSCIGFRGYPNGNIYNGRYSQQGVDPCDVVRYIWDWLQGQPDGNLGLTVDNTHSPVNLGLPLTTYGNDRTLATIAGNNNLTQKQIEALNPSLSKTEEIPKGVKVVLALNPYRLDWWNGTDLGQEITNLAQATPFDMTETHTFDPSQETVDHRLVIGYPRVGTRQERLRFTEGENITQLIPVDRNGTNYANEMLGIGAGTGSKAVRVYLGHAGGRIGRLRRASTFSDTTITDADKLRPIAQKALTARSAVLDGAISQCTWLNHANAPLGSFMQGDDILIDVRNGWLAGQSIWHRITAYTYDPAARTGTLSLARSDSYVYVSNVDNTGAPN